MNKPLFILLAFLLILSACQIKEFSMPVWDMDLKVPLMNERFFVSELVDSLHIITDENELLMLCTSGELSTDQIFSVSMNPRINLQNMPLISGVGYQGKIPLTDVEENAYLSYGILQSGCLRFRFGDMAAEPGEVCISLPDLKNPAGEPLRMEYQDQGTHQINLAGYQIGIRDSQIMIDSLEVEIVCESTLPPGSVLGYLSFETNELMHFSLFQGFINYMEISAAGSSSEIEVSYPFGLDEAITLQEASIEIEVENELCFSCDFHGYLEARRDGETVRIPVLDDAGNPYRIPAATNLENGRCTIVLHDNISQLMQIMPQQICIQDAKFIIDHESGFGCLSVDQEIVAQYIVNAPFRFWLHEHPFEIKEPLELEISEDNRKLIEKNLISAELELKVKNTLPIGGWGHAYFALTENIDIEAPDSYSFIKSLKLDSALVNDDWQDIEGLNLSNEELQLFTHEKIYVKWVFSFQETNEVVEIYASTADYVAIKGNLNAKIRVEEVK